MIAVGPTRRQLLTAENTVRLIGNSFVFIGLLDTVYYFNQATMAKFDGLEGVRCGSRQKAAQG